MHFKWDLTRPASLILAAGFFILSACTTLSPDRTSDTRDGSQNALDSQLRQIDRQIAQHSEAPDLQLQRMEILRNMAMEEAPEQRQPLYREMVLTGSHTDLRRDADLQAASDKLDAAYETEFLQGEAHLQQDPDRSVVHFRNASTLRPEQADPYRHLSSIHYRKDRIPEALELLELSRESLSPFPSDLSERIAYLYLESGRLDAAVELYENLVRETPTNLELRHALSNAYMLNEQHVEAIRELRQLHEQDRDNPVYRQSLAAELFFLLQDRWTDATPANRSPTDLISDLQWIDEAIELLDSIHEDVALETDPYWVAQFYRNSGLYLMEMSGGTDEERGEEIRSRAEYLIKEAIPRWEEMAEQNPEGRELLLNLQELYLQLGLEERAREIENQLNAQSATS